MGSGRRSRGYRPELGDLDWYDLRDKWVAARELDVAVTLG